MGNNWPEIVYVQLKWVYYNATFIHALDPFAL